MTATAVSLVIAFITTPLLVRWLGAERFGAVRTLADWFGHLSLLEIGLGGAIPPLIALSLGRGDAAAARRIVGAAIRAFVLVGAAVLAGGLLIGLASGRLVQVDPSLLTDLRNAAFVGLVTALLYPLLPFQALLDASQRGYVIQWFSLAQSVTTAALALVLARAGWGITGQFIAMMAGVIVLRLGLAVAGERLLPGSFAAAARRPDRETVSSIRRLNISTFLFSLSGRIALYSDNIIVAAVLGPTAVTPLFVTQRLAGIAGIQLLAVGNASWAALAELHALERRDVFAQRLTELTRLVAGLAVAALVPIAAFNEPFVARWVGADAYAGDAVTLLACTNAWLMAILSLWGWCFSGTGQIQLLLKVTMISAVLNLVTSIAATKLIGVSGPLLGTLVGAGATSLWYLPLLLRRHFGVSPLGVLRAALIPVAWGIPAYFLLRFLAGRYEPRSWPALLGAMAASAVVLLAVWWRFALTEDERSAFRQRISALGSTR